MQKREEKSKQEIITIEEYLRKRSMIKEQEKEQDCVSGAGLKHRQGEAMELAELMYM